MPACQPASWHRPHLHQPAHLLTSYAVEPLLPDDDPDLTLARQLGAGADVPPEAAWLRPVEKYREATSRPPDAARSMRLWEGIAAQTRPAARLYRLPVWTRWAAAAALLVAVAVGALLWWPAEALTYTAAPGGTARTVQLPDGSEVTLRPGSSLEVLEAARYRLHGEAFFAVTHDPARAFTVEAGPATVAVLGTRFDVQAVGDSVAVFLESGRVRFAAGDSAVVLAPGQSSRLLGSVPARPRPADAEAALAWREGRLVFRSESVARVAREVELHYGIRLLVPPAQQNEPVTGTLVLGDRDDTLARLARVAGGRFEQMDDRTYRLVVE